MIISPPKFYQVNGEVCPVQASNVTLTVGGSPTILAAVTGKRHRVMGWIIQSNGATAGLFRLRSSGGTNLMSPQLAPPSTNGATDKLPIVDSGYFETLTTEGLIADVTVADINFTIFYISYTPQ